MTQKAPVSAVGGVLALGLAVMTWARRRWESASA